MAVEVATAYVSIVPSARGFTANLRQQIGSGVALGNQLGDETGKGFLGSFGKAIAGVGATIAAAFAIDKIIDVGAGAFRVAADFQQTRIAFEGLLGDVTLADEKLRELQEFAASTPFDFEQVSEAGRKLLSFGIDAERIIPILTNIGNAAATLGASSYDINLVTRALGQITSKGRVQLEELNQIAEAFPGFNPIRALAEGIGVSTAEFTEKLSQPGGALVAFGLTGAQAVDILIDAMGNMPAAAGAMERQAATLNGTIEKFRDTLKIIAIETLEPFLPGLAAGLNSMIPLVERAGAALPGLIQGGVSALGAGFDDLRAAIEVAAPVVVGLFDYVIRNQDAFAVAAAGVLTFAAAAKTITTTTAAVSTAQASIQAAGGIMALLGSQLGSLAPILASPLGIVIAVVAAVAAAFAVAYFKIEPFREAVDGVARVVRDVAVAAFERFVDVLPAVGRFLADVGARLVDAGRAVVDFALAVRDGAVAGFRALVDAGGDVASTVIRALTPLARWVDENLVGTFLAAADFVDAFIDLASNNIRNFFSAVGDVASFIGRFIDFPVAFEAIADVVLGVVLPAFEFAGRAISGFADVVVALVEVALPIVETFARGLWEVVKFNFILLKNIVEAGLGVLRGLFTLFAGIFRGDWERIWTGLTTIVTSVFGNLYDVLVGLFNGVKGIIVAAFQNFPELVSALFNLLAVIGSHLASITVAVASWIGQVLTQVILPGMVSWAGGLTEWFVTTAIPWFLEKSAVFLGTIITWMIDTIGIIAAHALEWAVALTDWVIKSAIPWVVEHSAVFLATMIQWVIDAAGDLARQAVDLAVSLSEWVVESAIPWVLDGLARFLSAIVGWVASSASALVGHVVALATALISFAANAAARVPGAMEAFAAALFGWLGGLPGRILAAVGDLSGILYGVGQDMIAGMINGVRSMAGALRDSVVNVVTSPIDVAKGVLGIDSPSKVFMQLGEWTGEGFALGLANSVGMVNVSAADMTTQMAAGAAPSVASYQAPVLSSDDQQSNDVRVDQHIYLSGRLIQRELVSLERSGR